MNETKKQLFLYIVFQLKEWYKKINEIKNDAEFNKKNDFSVLKVMKLLFFVCAKDKETLKKFQFEARPLGPVESEIYEFIKEILSKENDYCIIITKENTVLTNINKFDSNKDSFSNNNQDLKKGIDMAINNLKEINYILINYRASTLVDISHKWEAWKGAYNNSDKKMSEKSILEKQYYY